MNDTTDTSATYNGTAGNSYSFYSVATDNVGNQEIIPNSADDTVTVSGATPFTFDLDGDGQYLAAVDGLLFYGYLNIRSLPPFLRDNLTQQLADNLIPDRPDRIVPLPTGADIANYLEDAITRVAASPIAQDKLVDIDRDGEISASIDGLLLYGYLNIRGLPDFLRNNLTQQLADNLIPDDRINPPTGADIAEYIESYIV